jgi:hypothetical protein
MRVFRFTFYSLLFTSLRHNHPNPARLDILPKIRWGLFIGNNGVHAGNWRQENMRHAAKFRMICGHDNFMPGFQDGAVGQGLRQIVIGQAMFHADGPRADDDLIRADFGQGLLGDMADKGPGR